LDVFVAFGGGYDRSGTVSKTDIVNVISNEFKLTFDMEEVIFQFLI